MVAPSFKVKAMDVISHAPEWDLGNYSGDLNVHIEEAAVPDNEFDQFLEVNRNAEKSKKRDMLLRNALTCHNIWLKVCAGENSRSIAFAHSLW